MPLNDLYLSAIAASLVMAVAVAVAGFPFAYFYLSSVTVDKALMGRATWALLFFLGGVIGNLLAAIPNACLSGVGDVGWDNLSRTVMQLIGFLLIVLLLPFFPDIRLLSLIFLAQGIISFAGGHTILTWRHRLPPLLHGKINVSVVKRMYSESFPVLVTRLGVWLILESSLMIAGYVMGAGKVPDFAALRQVVMMGMSIPSSIPIALAPYAAAAYSEGDHQKVRYYYRKAVRSSLLLAALWAAGLLVWGPKVMDLWLGEGHFVGYAVLIPMVLACFLELHHNAHCFFVWSAGRWPFMKPALIAGFLNIVLAYCGCRYYGFAGLAWGTMVAQLLTNNWYGVYYTLRHLGAVVSDYILRLFLPVIGFLALLIAGGTGIRLGIERVLPVAGLAGVSRKMLFLEVATGVALTVVMAALLGWFALSEEDREELKGKLRRRNG
jgi:O-antigen/teichoic acid export membrane protein